MPVKYFNNTFAMTISAAFSSEEIVYVVPVLFGSVRESACLTGNAARKIGKSSSNAVLTVESLEKEKRTEKDYVT